MTSADQVEDGFDRAVSPGPDIEGPRGCGLKAIGAMAFGQPDDAKAGAKALFGMGPVRDDRLAKRRCRGADLCRLLADMIECPARIAAVPRRHVLGHGRMLVIAARPEMGGNALALEEDLDRSAGEPHLHFKARKVVRHAVVVIADFDVIIDTDPAQTPLRKNVRLGRKWLQGRTVDLFEKLAPRLAKPSDRSFLVQLLEKSRKRRVDLQQGTETAVAEPAEKPALHQENRLFCLGFIP